MKVEVKKYRLTAFDSINGKIVHRIDYTFKWDYNNHCWDVRVNAEIGVGHHRYTGDPEQLIEHMKERQFGHCHKIYWNVKRYGSQSS